MGRPPVHGQSNTPTYLSWRGMIGRCEIASRDNFARYGGRGIKVCARWRNDFAAFLADMGERPTPQHTVERIDNDGDYTPGNCRWATMLEQENNKSSNRIVTYRGREMTLSQAWRESGLIVPKTTLHGRLMRGWPVADALETQAQIGRNQWS